ncbi:MAG: prepilin-type N-terminal cleavage/methylation domain-containing protein [Alteromonadales bacterium]|nr:prepilin-type N-terminal cleavage/methylation domain-containing protein [Alteromonadales bacterium]
MLFLYFKKQSGFTLIELLVVLAIIGILTSVGVPSYNKFVEQGRFSHGYNNLYNAYRFARAEAIKTSSPMVLDAKDGDWNKGWIVYKSPTSSAVLLDSPPVKSGINVTASTITVSGQGSLSSPVEFTVTGPSGRSRLICIIQNGQSYNPEIGGGCSL